MRGSKARFTDLQGQYLAFIEAYTTLQASRPRKLTCSASFA